MRLTLAAAIALLVLVTAVAPHAHGGVLGDHACAACLAASGEEAQSETPEVMPPSLAPARLSVLPPASPGSGFPIGAVPGQSPPS